MNVWPLHCTWTAQVNFVFCYPGAVLANAMLPLQWVTSFSFHNSPMKSKSYNVLCCCCFSSLLSFLLLIVSSFSLIPQPGFKICISHCKKMWCFPKKVYNLPPCVVNLFIIILELFFMCLNCFHLFLSETIQMEKLKGKETSNFCLIIFRF